MQRVGVRNERTARMRSPRFDRLSSDERHLFDKGPMNDVIAYLGLGLGLRLIRACLKSLSLVAAEVKRRRIRTHFPLQIRLLTSAATVFKQALSLSNWRARASGPYGGFKAKPAG